jgi:hypothetical protein
MTLAGAMGCSVDATPARDLMTEIRKQNEVAMRERLLKARKSGELPKGINVDDYTSHRSSPVYPSRQRMVRRARNSSEPPRWPFAIWVTEPCCGRSGCFSAHLSLLPLNGAGDKKMSCENSWEGHSRCK